VFVGFHDQRHFGPAEQRLHMDVFGGERAEEFGGTGF